MSRLSRLWLAVAVSLLGLPASGLAQTVSWIDDAGSVAASYVDATRARLRVVDAAANLSPSSAESVTVGLSAALSGDAESLSLLETGGNTGVFEGSIRLAPRGTPPIPGVLETAISEGSPPARDTLSASYGGGAPVSAALVGSRLRFLDASGQTALGTVPGQLLRLEVVDGLRNDPTQIDTFTVALSATISGDSEMLTVTETGPDTGLFRGQLATATAWTPPGDGTLGLYSGATITAVHPDADGLGQTTADLPVGDSTTEFVDAAGKPVDLYLESSRAWVRVIEPGANASPGSIDTLTVQLTTTFGADEEFLTLTETAPASGVFVGEIRLGNAPALLGNGRLETFQSAGPPHRFDTLTATRQGPAPSSDTAGLIGSLTRFLDAYGNAVESYAVGSRLYLEVTDHNYNGSAVVFDRVLVEVLSPATGDSELVELLETAKDSGIYRGYLETTAAATAPGSFTLSVQPASQIEARHQDAMGYTASTDLATIDLASIEFIEKSGEPTEELVEGGLARVRVVSPGGNGNPGAAESVPVDISSLYGGDFETLSLTETGGDTGVFEGALPMTFGAGLSGNGRLETANSGNPAYAPDTVTARLGPLSATAQTIGAKISFEDAFGRPAARYAVGERIFLRLVAPQRNLSPLTVDTAGVLLSSLSGGDQQGFQLTETGFDTGVFVGSIGTASGATSPGTFSTFPGDHLKAETPQPNTPGSAEAFADVSGVSLLWIDAKGDPAASYLESSRAYLRLVDGGANGNPSGVDTVAVQVTTELSGDEEILNLFETASNSGVFEISVPLALRLGGSPAQLGNGVLETAEAGGPPHEFDQLIARRADGTGGFAEARIGLSGSLTELVDAFGNPVESYAVGSRIHVQVTDHNYNGSSLVFDRVQVEVRSLATGDSELVELLETGKNTAVYEGSLTTTTLGSSAGDSTLWVQPESEVEARHQDAAGFTSSSDRASIGFASVEFIEATGEPTDELVEGGLARVRVVSPGGNSNSAAVETVPVELSSLYGGDSEIPLLTETGPDTGVFEGALPMSFGGGLSGNNRLETGNSGNPAYVADTVTARFGPMTATARTIGARLFFEDAFGRPAASYAVGERLYLRALNPLRNNLPSEVETMGVMVSSLAGGDAKGVTLTETGFNTGVFAGSLATGAGPSGPELFLTFPGDRLRAEHPLPNAPGYAEAFADVNGSSLLWIDAAGQPAFTYLESSRAYLRLVDRGANGNPSSVDTTTVQVMTELSGDEEFLSLTETSADSGVFEGSAPLALRFGGSPPQFGNSVLETAEAGGPPHEFDQLIARRSDGTGGFALARIGLLGSKTELVDAFGNPVDSYAAGARIYVRVTDHNYNGSNVVFDRVQVEVRSLATGDSELVELLETGKDTAVYLGSLPSTPAASGPGDLTLAVQPGSEVEARHQDAAGYTASSDRATIEFAAIEFIEATGEPTAELVEGGTLRVRVVSQAANQNPNGGDAVQVELSSLFGGDFESLTLFETGLDSGVFEGAMPMGFGGGLSGNNRLETANGGHPEYTPDTVTARLGPVTATARTIGARLFFEDAYGRTAARYAVGERLYLRVVNPLRNNLPSEVETTGVLVSSLEGGDTKGVTLTETGFNTGVFTGSIATGAAAAGPELFVTFPGDRLKAEQPLPNAPGYAQAFADVSGVSLLWIDEEGNPAASYLESSRAYLRLVARDANTNPSALDTAGVQVTTELSGDEDLSTLTETAPDSGVFEGSARLALRFGGSPPQFGNSVLETAEAGGPPHEFDQLIARRADGTGGIAEARIGLLGSQTELVDAFGNPVDSYAVGARIYVRVTDHNYNGSNGVFDRVQVEVRSLATGDAELVELLETAKDSAVYVGSLPSTPGSSGPGDLTLRVQPDSEIEARHNDAAGYTSSSDRAAILYSSVEFFDEAGAPTTDLVEGGVARVRVAGQHANTSPETFDSMPIELSSAFGGDREILTLNETGRDTGVFEGVLPLGFGGGFAGNGRLETGNSGHPEYAPDTVTASLGRIFATARTIGARVFFEDAFGRTAARYAVGERLYLRVAAPLRNNLPSEVETMGVMVSSLSGGDAKGVTLAETGFNTGVFTGSIATGAASGPETFSTFPGDRLKAETPLPNAPGYAQAFAEVSGASLLWIDAAGAAGQPAASYLESSRAYLRLVSRSANGNPSALDTTSVQVTTELSGDEELLTLTETAPDSGVFEGSAALALRFGGSPPQFGNSVLETAEAGGPPHEFDQLIARRADGTGGIAEARIGLTGSLTELVDAFGNPADSYALGSRIYVRVTDHNYNGSAVVFDRVQVEVSSLATGDSELVELLETGKNTGVYQGSLASTASPSGPGDLALAVQPQSEIEARHADAAGYTASSDRATIKYASIELIDATGEPTAVLVEGGVVRVRVVSPTSNGSPGTVESTPVELSSAYGGDLEILALTETGADTGVFEGALPLGFGGGLSGNNRLETGNSGHPEYAPDTVTASYGPEPVTATARTIGARLFFEDAYGRTAARYAVGERLYLRVVNPLRNNLPSEVETTGVLVSSLEGGDTKGVTLTETGFNTGVFTGSIATGAAAAGPELFVTFPGDRLKAEQPLPNAPGYAQAFADVSGVSLLWIDEEGNPAASYLESSRVYLRLVARDANTNSSALDTTGVQVTTELSGDEEPLTLTETAPDSGVFEGSARLALRFGGSPPQPGNSVLETAEAGGPPHEFDQLIARRADGTGGIALARIGLSGSITELVDAYGNPAESYAVGSRIYLRVTDHNYNGSNVVFDRVQVEVRSPATGDSELIELLETGKDTAVYVGSLATTISPSGPGDLALSVQPESEIEARHADAAGYTASTDRARIDFAAVEFIEATREPTAELVEGGLARVRVVSPGANGSPGTADSVPVELSSRYGGDLEILTLTETGTDTGVFEGSLPMSFGGGLSANGRLETGNSGHPEYVPDTVTARYGPFTATARTVGLRVLFEDAYGREASRYAVGERLHLRVVAPLRNSLSTEVETAGVMVSSLEGGDAKGVTLTETGFNTGVFTGSIATGAAAGGPELFVTFPGDRLKAELPLPNASGYAQAFAQVAGTALLWIDEEGNPAPFYLESSQATLRMVSRSANWSPFSVDAVSVHLTTELSGDLELLLLTETAPDSGVFEASVPLALLFGGSSPEGGSGVLETTEAAGPPHEFDTLIARHPYDPWGAVEARVGLRGSITELVDAWGNPVDSYAAGSLLYLRVTDHNADGSPSVADLTQAEVRSLATGDSVLVTLTETAPDSAVFTGSLATTTAPSGPGDQLLGVQPESEIEARHQDAAGFTVSADRAAITFATITFIEETGEPTAELVEGRFARVRLVHPNGNFDPGTADTASIELRSVYGADSETLTLTETGVSTGVFEGALPLAPGGGFSGNGRLETSSSGYPEYAPDTVTAIFGPSSATARTVGARIAFLDARGRRMERYALGSRLRLRIEDGNRNGTPDPDSFSVMVESSWGDSEILLVTETGPQTGVFYGELTSTPSATGWNDGTLNVIAGGAAEARHYESLSPRVWVARATFTANPAPVAVADSASTISGQPVVVPVLANDSGTGPLSVGGVATPLHGTAVVNPDGTVTYTSAPGFVGTDAFAYVVVDGNDFDAVTEVTVVVAPANRTPTPQDDTATTPEDQAIVIDVLANDTDPDGDELSVVAVTQPSAGGIVALGPDRRITFTPTPNYHGTQGIFQYTVRDPGGLEATATVQVTVTPVNDAPVAADDTATTSEDQGVSIPVAANDSDIDSGSFTVTAVTQPAHGQAEIGGNGTVYYLPAPQFHGTDAFTYTLTDSAGATDTATVTVTVTPVNDAPVAVADSATVAEDGTVAVAVLGNDTDPENDTLSVSAVTQGTKGAVAINGDGTVQYTPSSNANGSDIFTYTVSDGQGGTAVGTVSVTITAVNDSPVAVADSATVEEDGTVAVPALGNDTDPENDTLSVTAVTQGTKGAVAINGNGTVQYTPAPNANGSDSFTYTVSDGQGGTAVGTVSVTITAVNDAPVAVADSATVAEDGTVAIAVRSNDTDLENDTLTVTAVTQGTKGAVAINGDGTVQYTPSSNATGSDSFTYTVSDGQGGTATGTVSVTITAVNDSPVAVADSATVAEDGTVAVAVLGNDTDPENDTLSVSAVTQGTKGAVAINGDGTAQYTPSSNANGSDSFTYTVSDGQGGTATGTVSVTITAVNDSPVAVADSATVAEDGTVAVAVLGNDTDPENDTLSVTAVTQGTKGAVAINGDGTVQYTPSSNANGSDSFTYTVSDGQGGTATGTVSVTITAVNDAPVAVADSTTVAEDGTVAVPALGNDTDPENDTLSVTAVTQGTKGAVAINGNGTVQYTPSSNANGSDSFTYTISDGQGGTAVGTVSITITAVNDAPVAVVDSATVAEDGTVAIAVRSNDTDAENNTLTVTAVTQGTKGAVAINGNGTVQYTPSSNANGSDSFTYTISDGQGGTAVGTVSVTITAVNDAPVAVADSATTVAETPVVISAKANDTDVDGPSLTITSVTPGSNGSVVLNANQTVTFTPANSFIGSASFTYALSDGAGGTATGTVSVTVTKPPRVATSIQALYTFSEGSGTVVHDSSGVAPAIDLTITNPSAVTWGAGTLTLNSATLLESAGSATKVINAAKATNQLTLETWVVPANLTQTGPAQVVACSQNGSQRNFSLGQSAKRYDARPRTSTTGNGGFNMQTTANSVPAGLAHVVFTYDSTGAKMYIDGVQSTTYALTGTFSNWNSGYKLGVGADLSGVNPFRGTVHLVAIYNRGLSSAEVRQNFLAGAS